MPRKPETFTSLDHVPDVSKEDQTRLWTEFYIKVKGEPLYLDDRLVDSLQSVVSANLGEEADRTIIASTIQQLLDVSKKS